jgi:hypothetical protein
MPEDTKRYARGALCLIGILAYFLLYPYLRASLTDAIDGLPTLARKAVIIFSFAPVWLLAAYFAARVLRPPRR